MNDENDDIDENEYYDTELNIIKYVKKIDDLKELKQNIIKLVVSGSHLIKDVIRIAPTIMYYYNYYKFVRIFI